MVDRDVETVRSRIQFVATLRRVADAIEQKLPVRIQVGAKRFLVPTTATLSVEHETSGSEEELELQLRWRTDADPARGTPPRKAARKAGKSKPAKRRKR